MRMITLLFRIAVGLACCLALITCAPRTANSTIQPENGSWHVLLIDSFKEWDTYLGPPYAEPTGREGGTSMPLGLNHDPRQVFQMVTVDDQPALRVSGEVFGGISTKQEFENYHLQLAFKWGKLKWPPKENAKRDSGLLYHAVGPHGADGGWWMRSQEFQIQEGDCGDYWGVAGGMCDVPAIRRGDSSYVYDATGPLLTFSAHSAVGRRCIKQPDAEKPTGEWNTLDLYCHGDTSVHVVNGVVTMVLYHSRQEEHGRESPLTKGKIQLQSEGAEIFYRQIQIRPLSQLPAALLSQNHH